MGIKIVTIINGLSYAATKWGRQTDSVLVNYIYLLDFWLKVLSKLKLCVPSHFASVEKESSLMMKTKISTYIFMT